MRKELSIARVIIGVKDERGVPQTRVLLNDGSELMGLTKISHTAEPGTLAEITIEAQVGWDELEMGHDEAEADEQDRVDADFSNWQGARPV